MNGTSGDDFLWGTNAGEYISGGPYDGLGEDMIFGNGGDDTIYGGLQDDYMSGGSGSDTFIVKGVDGWDTFNGGNSTDIYGQQHIDKISIQDVSPYAYYSLLKIDNMTGIEKIENNDSKDAVIQVRSDMDFSNVDLVNIKEIRGSNGGETIWGSQDDDTIDGDAGNDTLEGEGGDDFLTGGADADVFVFQGDDGNDHITDFEDGVDLIRLENTSASDISDLTITQEADGAKIVVDSTTIWIDGFDTANLSNADFDFV